MKIRHLKETLKETSISLKEDAPTLSSKGIIVIIFSNQLIV
jgi:hypothetical protein